jgi:two-component system, chemotaxis family, response regulator WspF
VRIAVAHPERAAREAMKRALAARANTQLLWVAGSDVELERSCAQMAPDLLLLDVTLSGNNGALVKKLVNNDVCAVLMLADDPDRAVASVYEALANGALAVAYPPSITVDGELSGATQLLARLDRIASLVRARGQTVLSATHMTRANGKIFALGASTGGPSALAKVISDLPQALPVPVLIVQHIEGEFIAGLAEWLAKTTKREVVLAKRGDLPQPGRIYLADGAGHLVYLPSGQLTYLQGNAQDLHVPSVDMLFNSLAENAVPGASALLTGMGADGASGLLKMRQRGWFTIAQDEASSAVFGMPRAAVQLGAATRIIELSGIGTALAQQLFRS